MVTSRILILALCLGAVACTPTPKPEPTKPRIIWCDHNQPIRLTSAEIAASSDDRLRQVAEHNGKGAAWCGWKPKG